MLGWAGLGSALTMHERIHTPAMHFRLSSKVLNNLENPRLRSRSWILASKSSIRTSHLGKKESGYNGSMSAWHLP